MLVTSILNNSSPIHNIFDQNLDYNALKTIHCTCCPYLRPYNKHKLDFKYQQCVLLGYSDNHKGYICLNIYAPKSI